MVFAAPLLGARDKRKPVAVPGRDRARGIERRRFSGSTDGQLSTSDTIRSERQQSHGKPTEHADVFDLLGAVGKAVY